MKKNVHCKNMKIATLHFFCCNSAQQNFQQKIIYETKTTKSSLTSGRSSDWPPPPEGIAKILFAI